MPRPTPRRRFFGRWLSLAAAWLGVGCGAAKVEAPPHTAVPPAAASLRAYRDPASGDFAAPPPGADSLAAAGAARRAAPALVEEAAPGGGRMVRLQGAFRADMVARSGADGAAVSCGAPREATQSAPTARR